MSKTKSLALAFSLALFSPLSMANQNYKVQITNGSNMPISPGLVYASPSAHGLAHIGSAPTAGFVKLCQTGDNSLRSNEVQMDMNVSLVEKTMGPILPGQTAEVNLRIDSATTNLHFEAMYGKTKDVCSIATVLGKDLASSEVVVQDTVVQTGAFSNPATPPNANPQMTCSMNQNAVDCLRALSMPTMQSPKIRYFAGYLPSLFQLIEQRYGSRETESLLIPTSGAVTIKVTRE